VALAATLLSVYSNPATSDPFNLVNGPALAVLRYTLYPETADALASHVKNTFGAELGCATAPDSGTPTDELLALLATVSPPV
jgi:hypothetical protein